MKLWVKKRFLFWERLETGKMIRDFEDFYFGGVAGNEGDRRRRNGEIFGEGVNNGRVGTAIDRGSLDGNGVSIR